MNEVIPLGRLIGTSEMDRDAVHIAIVPVFAGEKLAPGAHVGFIDDQKTRVGKSENPVGIVDPFLADYVLPGQKLYLCLYPNSITSLKHNWTHPAFGDVVQGKAAYDKTAQQSRAEEWLRAFALDLELSYTELMDGLKQYRLDGSCICLGFELPDCVSSEREFMWEYYADVTGETLDTEREDGYAFRCAC